MTTATTTTTATRTWKREEIEHLLETSNKMLMRSLVKIFEKQTEDEKRTEGTRHSNGVGFNSVDAQILSSFAKQVLRYGRLSDKQLSIARRKIMKYAGQLTKIANGKL